MGALFLVDIAHIAGLVATGVHPTPVPYADIITSTTHKTLRGPRGGFILAREAYAKKINAAVFPGIQGGPLMHVITAKAIAFKDALEPQFSKYTKQIVINAQALAKNLIEHDFELITGGTDNHIVLIDLRPKKITGAEAATRLEQAGIVTNKNSIPNDPQGPRVTSGIRLGVAAVTTRGMVAEDMSHIANFIKQVIHSSGQENELARIREQVKEFCNKFPVFADDE